MLIEPQYQSYETRRFQEMELLPQLERQRVQAEIRQERRRAEQVAGRPTAFERARGRVAGMLARVRPTASVSPRRAASAPQGGGAITAVACSVTHQ